MSEDCTVQIIEFQKRNHLYCVIPRKSMRLEYEPYVRVSGLNFQYLEFQRFRVSGRNQRGLEF